MRNVFIAAIAASLLPTAAAAEGPYIGAQIGYHDIDVDTEEDGDVGLNSVIYGIYAGYDIALSGPWILGIEANFNLGTGDFDSDYGAAARVGMNVTDKALLFVRGGYQEVDLDTQSILESELGRDLTSAEETEVDGFDLDDSDGGWLVGLGGEYDISEQLSLRVALDTIEFDSARVTAGISFRF